jgi:hypothetical protein
MTGMPGMTSMTGMSLDEPVCSPDALASSARHRSLRGLSCVSNHNALLATQVNVRALRISPGTEHDLSDEAFIQLLASEVSSDTEFFVVFGL